MTGALPAFLLLTGNWADDIDLMAIALAVFGVVVFGALYPRLRSVTPAATPLPRSDRCI